MFEGSRRIFGIFMVLTVAACDDGMGPLGGTATVRGSVEATSEPAPSSGMAAASSPSAAGAAGAQTVAVVQLRANGTFAELATASVAVDGSFEVENVPAGRADLAVVAYAGGGAVGGVLIHETSRAGAVIITAPIDHETSVEAAAYAQVRASGGTGSASELALLVHTRGSSAATVAGSEAEIEALAAAYLAASDAMTRAYTTAGASLSAASRARVLGDAAIQFAVDRHAGMSAGTANAAFTAAALDAYTAAGARLEQSVVASAAAATVFDATLSGRSSARTDVVAQAVRMNLLARERLAAELSTGAEASIGHAVRVVLGQGRLALALDGVLDLRAVVEATADAAADAVIEAVVELVASGASSAVETEVRAKAESAVQAASLEARLQGAVTAHGAASAAAGYQAAVRAAVDSMIAVAGDTTVRADVLTALFIAACGSAYVQ